MIATACDVGGSFGPLGCSRHVVSPATRPTATTGENRVMREPMAHLWPGAYLPRRSRALEVGAGSGTNGTKLRRFAGQRKLVGRPAALPTTYVPSEGPMLQYTYLIVGGGMTADAAAQGIREGAANGTIGLVGPGRNPPYNRPPLSKALWKGDPEESIWRKTAATGAQLTLGRRVAAIDPRGHTATDDRGTAYRFAKLLLATGGLPRRLPAQSDAVIYFRTLEDYRRLRVENGIVVDAFCRTSQPDVYAAGDVANFANPALGDGTRLRVEHEDNANAMGRVAGLNMAGRATHYDHLPFFYSDLFELGYEAVGDLDARLETVADWKDPFREGVVYYLRDGRVRGALLWNTWGQVDHARALIAEPGPFRSRDLKGRLPR